MFPSARISAILRRSLSESYWKRGISSMSINEAKGGNFPQVNLEIDSNMLHLQWSDQDNRRDLRLNPNFLRASCQCGICQHGTGQRLVNISDLPEENRIEAIEIGEDGIHIVWKTQDHTSFYGYDWLCQQQLPAASKEPYPLTSNTKIPRVSFVPFLGEDTYTKDHATFDLLDHIFQHGLCLIENTPTESGQLEKVVNEISPASHGYLYGDYFDVVSKMNAENIAYTDKHLKCHMDLAYYESPPGLQMLHCISFSDGIRGGESMFIDAHLAAETLREVDEESFEILCRVPATFRKYHLDRATPIIMEYKRPHIAVNHEGAVTAVFWSPPFEGTLDIPEEDMEAYLHAYRQFDACIHGKGNFPDLVCEHRLQEGEVVIFNQRRILHGRRAFGSVDDSIRHFQGGYMNIDEAMSKYRVLGNDLVLRTPLE